MKKTLYIIALLPFLVACTEDVLDKEPLDRFSDATIWNDLNLVSLFENEVYNGIENWVTGGTAPGAMVDESYSNFNWCGERTVTHGLLTPDNSKGVSVNYNKGGNDNGRWGYYYKKIRAVNIFFANIDNVPGDKDLINRMKGEMYFLRAYFYAELVNFYGGVPIISKVFDINSSFEVTKNTYEDCINFIATQADSAVALLPYTYDSKNIGRATKGAAMSLKAQELLYAASPLYNNGTYDNEKLRKAKLATEAVINLKNNGSKIYSLYSPANYRSIFLDYENSEVIFAKYTSDAYYIDRENSLSRDLGINSIHGYAAYSPLQQLVDEFEVTNGTQTVIPVSYVKETGRVVTTSNLYNDQNPYVNRDPRFYANILYDGALYRGTIPVDTYVGGKDSPQALSESWNASKSGYYLRKFTTEKVDIFSDPPKEDIMWIVYRLSEFYLNEAEILYELGETDTEGHNATWYINQIRQRSCVDIPLYTSVNRENIRHERRIELCFEGNRYYDVRRWQIYDQVLFLHLGIRIDKLADGSKTYRVKIVDNKVIFDPRIYYLPIPSSEILKDHTLGQSPGW